MEGFWPIDKFLKRAAIALLKHLSLNKKGRAMGWPCLLFFIGGGAS